MMEIKMDWTSIWENVISSTISGVAVVAICGIFGFLIYVFGIKGKENNHNATGRKEKIYIPLKDELEKLSLLSDDIWKRITSPELLKVINKDDEINLPDELYKKCIVLRNMIDEYHKIDLYNTVGEMLTNHFVERYAQLYGSAKCEKVHWDESIQAEFEYEDWVPEVWDFITNVYEKEIIDNIFKYSRGEEEYCIEKGYIGPAKEYLLHICTNVLPKKEKKYEGIQWDVVKCEALQNRRITPADYIMKDYEVFEEFGKHELVIKKNNLLDSIRAQAHDIHEDVSMKIRYIVKKYELE